MIHQIELFVIQYFFYISLFFLVFLASIIAIEKLMHTIKNYIEKKRIIELDNIVNNLNKNLLRLNSHRTINTFTSDSNRIRSFNNMNSK